MFSFFLFFFPFHMGCKSTERNTDVLRVTYPGRCSEDNKVWWQCLCIRYYSARNFQSRRHIGHWGRGLWEFTHFKMQCRWNAWLHAPHIRGQSSPGILQSGQHPSNAIRHIPQASSCASQVHDATACHSVSSIHQRKRNRKREVKASHYRMQCSSTSSPPKPLIQTTLLTIQIPAHPTHPLQHSTITDIPAAFKSHSQTNPQITNP